MQREKPGCRQKGERHEVQPGIVAAICGLPDEESQHDIGPGRDEHQPEMPDVVFPHEVELGLGEQEPQAGDGQRYMESPDDASD